MTLTQLNERMQVTYKSDAKTKSEFKKNSAKDARWRNGGSGITYKNDETIISRKLNFVGTMWKDDNKKAKAPKSIIKSFKGSVPDSLDFEVIGPKKNPKELILSDMDLANLISLVGNEYNIIGYSFGTNISTKLASVNIHLAYKSVADSDWKKLPKLG